jgi:hypothetical protein
LLILILRASPGADYTHIQTVFIWSIFIPEPTARSAVPGVSPGEGTNSARLFTPGEREALAKSKVHQWSRARVTNRGWSSSLISKIWLFARCGISKISIFKSVYLENHVSHNELWSNFCSKKWEELIYCVKSWNIGQVCFEYLMFMNFVALIYCIKHALLSFSMKLY